MDALTLGLCLDRIEIHGIGYTCQQRGEHEMHAEPWSKLTWTYDMNGQALWTFAT